MNGFVKLIRGTVLEKLMRDDPTAFLLLTQIALRADRKTGVALVGDYRNAGIKTENQYRGTKKRLIQAKICTFQSTNKGTLATICNSIVYDINQEGAERPKTQAPPLNGTTKSTTNKKYKEKKGQELEIIY